MGDYLDNQAAAAAAPADFSRSHSGWVRGEDNVSRRVACCLLETKTSPAKMLAVIE